jgi:hypothetical protein
MEIHIKITGILLMILALAHIVFPKYFNWKEDLKPLSLINRQMMIVHTFFVAFMVFLMGMLCWVATEELIHTKLGKLVSLGFAIFWTARLVIQFFGYSSELWKGKTFETIAHILFSGLWIYLSGLFWLNYLQ